MAYSNSGNSFQRTSPIVLNLIIINTLVFMAQYFIYGDVEPNPMTDHFALHHYKSTYFQSYQLLTHMFMHGGFFHLLFNMFALWMFGSIIERTIGTRRFLILYFVCGIFAGLAQLGSYAYDFRHADQLVLNPTDYQAYQDILRTSFAVGASGAIMGVLAAFGFLFPNTPLIIIPIPIPIKAKWAILGMISLDVFGGVVKVQGDNIAHFDHLGGALMGFLLVLYWNKSNRKTFY